MNRRRLALPAVGEDWIPGTHIARVVEDRLGELERECVGVVGRADVLPIEDELADVRVPVRRVGREVSGGEALRRRVGVAEERRSIIFLVARPPTNLDQLRIAGIAQDEVVPRRVGRLPGEELDREIEGAPPGVHGRRAPPERRAELRQNQRRLSGGREVGVDLVRFVGGVLAILVKRDRPRDLLRVRVDLDLSRQAADGIQDLAGHLGDRPVRGQRDSDFSPSRVLHERLVGAQVEAGDDRPGTIWGREWVGLPAARRETERGVLKLPLERREFDRELAEDLGVGVERDAGLAPGLVGEGGPGGRHAETLLTRQPLAAASSMYLPSSWLTSRAPARTSSIWAS